MTKKGRTMMEEELRQLLREQEWSLYIRKSGSRRYFYALKWKQNQVYIASESTLSKITREDVLKKLPVTK